MVAPNVQFPVKGGRCEFNVCCFNAPNAMRLDGDPSEPAKPTAIPPTTVPVSAEIPVGTMPGQPFEITYNGATYQVTCPPGEFQLRDIVRAW